MKDGAYSFRAPKEYVEEAMDLTGAENESELFLMLLLEKLGIENKCKKYKRKKDDAEKKTTNKAG